MELDRRKLLWFGLSTAIIVAMAYFADFARVFEALLRADLRFLMPAFVFGMSMFGFWSYNWWKFFHAIGMDIGYWKSLRMFMAGQFFNFVTPLGQFGGEPFMAYVISKATDYKAEKAFSAVVSADIVNAAPPLTFMVGGAFFQLVFRDSVNQLLVQILYIAIVAFLFGGTVVYLLWFKSGVVENLLVGALRKISGALNGLGESYVDRLDKKIDEIQEAFSAVGDNPGVVVRTAAVGHLAFFSQVLCLAMILLSLGFEFTITPLYFAITLSALANFSPTPGGSGTFEAAMAGLLTLLLGIPFASAFIAAVMFRFTTYWPGLVLGWVSLNTLGER